MNRNKKQTRTPFLSALRKAFHVAERSHQTKIPAEDIIGMELQKSQSRRRFIGDALKASLVIGAAGIVYVSRKVTDHVSRVQPKIVIVGAGMAGLNCAYQLQKAGYSSSVFEGSSRTGGRIFSKGDIMATGLYTELGGEFINSDHSDILSLCQEFSLPLLDTRTSVESQYDRESFYIDGRFHSEAEIIKAFQPYAARIISDIDLLPDDIGYDNFDAPSLRFDRLSLHEYLDSLGMNGFIRKGIETAYLSEYGLETGIQSAINFLYMFSSDSANSFEIFGESDERYKIEGGNQTLTNAIHHQLKNNIYQGYQLVKISENTTGYSLYFSDPKGTTIKVDADMVVLSIPFTTLRQVQMDVSLPTWKTNAIENVGYGTNAKLLIGFNERVWRNYQYSGYAFTEKMIQNSWDNSWAQSGESGGYTIFQGGNKGIELGTGTPEFQARKFIEELDHLWPGCKAAFNGNVKRMHWPTYPYTKGSYACYKTGQYTSIRGAEIKPVGNLFFAGEHCSKDFQGYMNGAAETGRLTAQNILKSIKTGIITV